MNKIWNTVKLIWSELDACERVWYSIGALLVLTFLLGVFVWDGFLLVCLVFTIALALSTFGYVMYFILELDTVVDYFRDKYREANNDE